MPSSTDPRPLKVLTPSFSARLGTFNKAARLLQEQGVRMHRLDLIQNRICVGAEDARRLKERYQLGMTRTQLEPDGARFTVPFQGITLEWFEPKTLTVH